MSYKIIYISLMTYSTIINHCRSINNSVTINYWRQTRDSNSSYHSIICMCTNRTIIIIGPSYSKYITSHISWCCRSSNKINRISKRSTSNSRNIKVYIMKTTIVNPINSITQIYIQYWRCIIIVSRLNCMCCC